MMFQMTTLHLGDVLMAAPAMRRGDIAVAKPRYQVPELPVDWAETGSGVMITHMGHPTENWLKATGRPPKRHRLMPQARRRGILLAPQVSSPRKQWGHWRRLQKETGATLLSGGASRQAWMHALNEAETVVCPDTGTAHMADALGVPRLIALYAAADFERFAPYWDRSHCLVADTVSDITVEDVMEKLRG